MGNILEKLYLVRVISCQRKYDEGNWANNRLKIISFSIIELPLTGVQRIGPNQYLYNYFRKSLISVECKSVQCVLSVIRHVNTTATITVIYINVPPSP